MMENRNSEEEFVVFLRKNKPKVSTGSPILEDRILHATVLKPTLLQILLHLFKSHRLIVGISSAALLAALLLFSLNPKTTYEEDLSYQAMVVFSEPEQYEIASFMESTWQQTVGDSNFSDLMEETSL